MNIAPIRKALVPVGVMAILSVLAVVGITEQMTVEDAVTLLVTSGFVWLIPNKTA